MTRASRLTAFLTTAFAVIALNAATAAPLPTNTATGTYLAGQQALVDLSTREAADLLSRAAKADWDNPVVIERAFMALAADGRIEDAAAMAKHMLELDPNVEFAKVIIAAVEINKQKYNDAIQTLAGMELNTYPGIAAIVLRGWAYVGAGKGDEAQALLEGVDDEGLADFFVRHRALMADVAGNTDLALSLGAEAYEADPNVARLVEGYTRMLGHAGKADEAKKIIGEFEAKGLAHPLVAEVKSLLDKGETPTQLAANPQQGAAEMFHDLGVVLSREVLADYPAVFLRLAMYLTPQSDIIPLSLAQLFDFHSRHEAANALYDGIPSTSPMKPVAVLRVAQNLDALGNRPEAIRQLEAIVKEHPDDLDAITVLGHFYRDEDRFAEAAATYTKAIELTGGTHPADWRLFHYRGIAYERNKQWPEAEADFLAALKLNPDEPDVLNYLGYTWVDKGMNLDQALQMIEKAVAAAPNSGYIVDSLGWAFYRLGRFDEAVKTLEQAVQLQPNDPEINDHLGDAYWRVGRKLEARFQWNIASAMDEDGNVKARVMPKLANGLDGVVTTPPPETAASAQN